MVAQGKKSIKKSLVCSSGPNLNATLVPIAKPGKDSKDPNNYCPIALTRCVCKTMERMINDCLVWFLESSSLITDSQSKWILESKKHNGSPCAF